MKFGHNFYILVIFLTKIIWIVVSEENFGEVELTHLSNKLSPIECLRLLETMNLKTPLSDEEYLQSDTKISLNDKSIFRRQLEMPLFNRDNCYNKLHHWSRNMPQKRHGWARKKMETGLRNLGRMDLAKYVKRSRKTVRHIDDLSRNPKNVAMQADSLPQMMNNDGHAIKPEDTIKRSRKIPSLQYYPFGSMNSARTSFASRETSNDHQNSHKSETNDTSTRWIAFSVLIGVIVLTILATVVFALYKKNRRSFCTREKKCKSNLCPLANRPRPSHCVVNVDDDDDDDDDDDKDEGVRSFVQRRDSEFLSDDPPPSPTSGKSCLPRKRRANKNRKTQREEALEKSMKCGHSKKSRRLKKGDPKSAKRSKTKDSKTTEKSAQLENHPAKHRLELKTFQEKIASILRKDNPPCKCCKCVFNPDEKPKCRKFFGAKKINMCQDENCPETEIERFTNLYCSPDTSSPPDECNEIEQKKIKEKKKKKKKKKPTKDKDSCKEKDFTKGEARDSSRSKDKNLCKIKKKPTKDKKEKYNAEEACTRKTCGYPQPNIEETSNFD